MEILIIIAVFLLIAGVFLLRLFVGEKTFWGRKYLRQGYQVLLSRRFDAYIIDTLAVCFFSLFLFVLCFSEKAVLLNIGAEVYIWLFLSATMFLCGRLLEKSCAFFQEQQGLLISKPFRPLRTVPWSEIGSIQKMRKGAQLYSVLDRNGKKLVWFPLNLKTQPFLDLAQKNGITVHVSKGSRMALYTSGKKLNGTLGNWNAALAQSVYARNDVAAFILFQDFIVVLFMDRQLNENNVAAINRDGTVRWKISDIIKQAEPLSCVALTSEHENTISVMTVVNRQYDCVIYEVDVYKQQVVCLLK